MRRAMRFLPVALLACVGMVLLDLPPAAADPECEVVHPETGTCLVAVGTDPQPPAPDEPAADKPVASGPGSACHWDPAKQGLSRPPAGPVPCTSEHGYWSNAHICYIERLNPQPPRTAPFWEGAYVEGGAVYQCFQPQTGTTVSIWLAEPPPASGAGPSPGEVARMAVDRMDLSAIDIGIVPEPGPDRIGLVGMPVWMWVDHPDSRTYGPTTATASAGGVTVTATARVERITWLMGDGTEVVCTTPGTPYRESFGPRKSPDCGHVYEVSSAGEPGDRFTVTARSDWVVTWEGAGQSGTIVLDGLERSVRIAIGEAQVLVT